MEAFIFYLIRASVYLLVFGLGYYLLLARQNARIFNRFYILFSFVISLGLASVGRISLDAAFLNVDEYFVSDLPEFLVVGRVGAENAGSWFQNASYTWLYWIPFVLMVVYLVVLFKRLLNLFRYIRQNPREKLDSMELVLISPHHSPFSFFHWIFIPSNMKESEHFQKVLTHEKAHYLLRHSWDVMFMEILRLLFWFHPMYYYLKRDLQTIHEYDADNFALRNYSRADYQRALLDFALGAHYLPITNPFNVSTIKKRFIMMNMNQHPKLKVQLFRLLLILPFVAAVFIIQSCSFAADEADVPSDTKTDETTSIEAPPPPPPTDPIFNLVDEEPGFPGGTPELMKFLQNNLTYPEKAKANKIQGTVFVTFVVEKDGSISDSRILRGIQNGAELDAEALRVINLMPEWQPGKQRGEAVRVQFNLPIRFVLN
jgi:TonB family protein